MRPWLFRLFLLLCALASPARAAPVAHVRIDLSNIVYAVNADQTYTETVTLDRTLLTPRGIRRRDRSEITYWPDQQRVEVLEAWVDQPDGSRLRVGPENRFTRPSESSQEAPGFTNSMTTTLVYPQLRPGSRTHVKFRLIQFKPPLTGFDAWSEAELEDPTLKDRIEIDLPASLALHWASRGAVSVSDTTTSAHRRIVAEMAPTPGQQPERATVDTSDFQPIFVATTLPRLQAIGALYHRQSQGRAALTPAITALAAKIAGDRTGLDAARAIYDWVSVNIRYIAVYLNPNDGWVPHTAAKVLANGYGDCKDHVVLMQALLAARGIAGEAALVQWGGRYVDLPLGLPGEFNHVLVYLPAYDLYLNPTDPYAPFGSLDHTLSGKLVVLATAAGQIARTPPSTPAGHRYAMASQLALAPDGTLTGTATWTLAPDVDASIRATLANATSPADLVERLLLSTPEGGFGTFAATDPRDLATPLALSAHWTSPHGVTLREAETAMTVPDGPNLQPAWRLRRFLSPDGIRATPMLVGATDLSWTTAIALPPGIAVARLPSDIALNTAAGRYAARYRRDGATVLVSRELVIDRDVFQPADYPALQSLLYAAVDDTRAALILSRLPPPAK